jgi:hypothetical protein
MIGPGNPQAPLVDWPLLLVLLRRRAEPLARIAAKVHMSEQMINRLARGDVMQPRFDQGVRLLAIASDELTPGDWQRVREASRLTQK